MGADAQSLQGLALQLVVSLRGDRNPAETARRVIARLKNDTGTSTRREWPETRAKLKGLIKSSRIRVEDDIADAFEKALANLEERRRTGGSAWEERLAVNTSNLPQHVQFLMALSTPSSEKTREIAAAYLVRPVRLPKSDLRLYRDIMSEPFEGDHWGPGWDEEVQEGWTDSEDSDPSATSSDDEIRTPEALEQRPKTAGEIAREAEAQRRADEQHRLLLSKLALRELEEGAYWKSGGMALEPRSDLQGWAVLSLLPTLASPALPPATRRAISATQFQRELLFALTGRPGVMFRFSTEGTCMINPDHPEVETFSPVTLDALLREFALHSMQTARLRMFIAETLTTPHTSNPHQPCRTSKTREAFAESCRTVLHEIGVWVADTEAAFLGAEPVSHTSTPLQLSRDFQKKFGELLEHLRDFIHFASSANGLLDAMYSAIVSPTTGFVRPALVRLFIQTAAPMWRMLGDWIMLGMPIPTSLLSSDVDMALQEADDERPLSPEFFIQRDIDSAWSDEDFWEVGFVVPGGEWPKWLEGAYETVMEGGKARGLLLSLTRESNRMDGWADLDTIIGPLTEDVGHCLTTFIEPFCQRSQTLLSEVLVKDCSLQEHLRAIDGLTLMQAPVVLEQWVDWLFNTMRAGKPWADFQLLTYSLRDAIEQQGATWMNAPAVRARALRGQGRATLADIRVDYLVPFPLSQLFTATSMEMRSEVFTFLLRLLKGRKLLLEARQVAEAQAGGRKYELGLIRRLRHALSWVLDTIWNWINGVLDVRSERHRHALNADTSFQRLINLELEHSRQLRYFCFMHVDTAASLETIEALLNLAKDLHHVASTTLGVAPPIPPPRPPRRRRRQTLDSDDSDEDFEESRVRVTLSQPKAGNTTLEDIRAELNHQVRALAISVDKLASEGGLEGAERRYTWGMLAFSLSDWKEIA